MENNRRVVKEIIIILLLILLLIFGALSQPSGPKTVVDGGKGGRDVSSDDPDTSTDATIVEDAIEKSNSAPEENKAIVETVTHSSWFNNGVYEVFGVVENVGNITARQVTARVIFKGDNWKRLGEIQTLVDNPTLVPGTRSDFKVIYTGSDAAQAKTYVLIFELVR